MAESKEVPGSEANQVMAHFHKTSKSFDAIYEGNKSVVGRIINRLFRHSIALRFGRVVQEVSQDKDATVLDVGCGAGRYAIALAAAGVGKIRGVDFAENMILEAIRRSKEMGLAHMCEFRQIDFSKMPEADTYDYVYAMGVLDYVSDPLSFVAKMHALSRKKTMISFPRRGGFVQWMRKQVFRWIKKCPVYFYTEQDVRNLAEKVGATRFSVELLAKDYFLILEK